MSSSSTVHGGQRVTKYVTFELLLHAVFVADDFWGFMREPSCTRFCFCVMFVPGLSLPSLFRSADFCHYCYSSAQLVRGFFPQRAAFWTGRSHGCRPLPPSPSYLYPYLGHGWAFSIARKHDLGCSCGNNIVLVLLQ